MAEAFVGKWKPDNSSMAGAQEYFAALGQPELLKEYEGVTETEVTLNGNTFTFVTRFENKDPRTDTFRLGESDEVSTPGGPTLVSKNRLEDGRFISDLYLGDKLLVNCVRVVQDGLLKYEFTANGKTMTFTSTKL
ncbi:unnamed protein product [Candidula unifasciata]|uniref:Fatty acid-binding protein n=1 Tax=Candidula unifasciata TaxID=100452 RepID=A0A8S3YXJ1_9EUPU|nr:unnamed protein product [Candidula unifasciata]